MIAEANFQWQYRDTECLNLPMPWYTLPTLKWLKTQDIKKWRVFEYGGGFSSIWWRMNCAFVDSVDHDKNWARAMGCRHISDEIEYTSSICQIDDFGQTRKYDCIIVDGVFREKCVIACREYLVPGGVLIIDNFNSEDYNVEATAEYLIGWKHLLFAQPNHSSWLTAVFFKPTE